MPKAYSYSKNYFTPKNILIYLIVGGLLYGAIYYLWIGKKGGYKEVNNVMTVALSAQNDFAEKGTVTFTEMNGKTTVAVDVFGASVVGSSQPAHIHVGACPNPGAIKYPLTNVVDGRSETILDVTLAQLKKELPLAINLHKSAAEAKVYVACGDLNGNFGPVTSSSSGY